MSYQVPQFEPHESFFYIDLRLVMNWTDEVERYSTENFHLLYFKNDLSCDSCTVVKCAPHEQEVVGLNFHHHSSSLSFSISVSSS